jgi:hypothetical protein
VNILNFSLDRYTDIIDELNSCYSFVENSIEVIYIEMSAFALNTITKIINFRDLCNKILTPNGIIILSYFNLSTEADDTDYLNCIDSNDFRERNDISISKYNIEILDYRKNVPNLTVFKCYIPETIAKEYSLIKIANDKFLMPGSRFIFSEIQILRKFLMEPRTKFHQYIGNINFIKSLFTVVEEITPWESQTVKEFTEKQRIAKPNYLAGYTITVLKRLL